MPSSSVGETSKKTPLRSAFAMTAASAGMTSHLDRRLERRELAVLERRECVSDLIDREALDEIARRKPREEPVRDQRHRVLERLPRVHQHPDQRALAALEQHAVEQQLRRP